MAQAFYPEGSEGQPVGFGYGNYGCAPTNPHRQKRLQKKGPNPYVILSEAKNLSFFS